MEHKTNSLKIVRDRTAEEAIRRTRWLIRRDYQTFKWAQRWLAWLELTIESFGPDHEISQALSSSLPVYDYFLTLDRRQLRRRRRRGQTYL